LPGTSDRRSRGKEESIFFQISLLHEEHYKDGSVKNKKCHLRQSGGNRNPVIKGLKIELTQSTKNLPSPLFAKEGKFLPL
jgi:hypothetical protein